MSNHNSNGMYNILNIFKKHEPTAQEQVKAEAKAIYESVEAQGSVLKGVEQTLNEKYMGFKKTVGALKKQGGVDNPEALAASIGRKKYGKAAFQKAAAAGKKMGEAVEVATQAPAAAVQPGPIVLVHKAYRENIAKAKEVLERFHHSEGIGKQLKLYPPSGKYGPDYYEFHLDKKPHNTVDMVERTLKSEGVKAGVVPGAQDDMEEGNEFSGALAQAKAQHKDEFEVDGKRYPVKENGLQRHIGIKKYTKKGFEELQAAGREGADEEEKGRIKDKYLPKKGVVEGDVVHKGRYGNDGNDYTGKTGVDPKVQADPENKNFDTTGIAGIIGKKTGKDVGRVTHRQKHDWDNSPEEVDEMFAFDTKGKDRGPRDTGTDELARRAKLGKNPITRHAPDYKAKDKYGNMYKIGGPKGQLPEEREVTPTIKGTNKKAKSVYNPANKPGHVKRLDTPTKKYDNVKNESRKTAHALVLESVNFKKMMDECDMTLNEMLDCLNQDIKSYKTTGDMTERLRDFMHLHNHAKKQLEMEAVHAPKGPSFAPQHAMSLEKNVSPFEPSRIQGTKPPGMIRRSIDKAMTTLGHGSDDEMLNDLRRKSTMEETAELNELARLAGLTLESSKGEYLGSKIAADKKAGKLKEGTCSTCDCNPCECDGKVNKLKEGTCKACDCEPCECDIEEGNAFTGKLADTKKGDTFKLGNKTYKDNSNLDESMGVVDIVGGANEMEQQQGNMSVNTNMSTDGSKTVSITANGDAAEELMQMLKIAGLGGGEAHAKLAIAVPTSGEEVEVAEADGEAEYANVPHEEYETVDTIIHQGDDMNREKKQFANMPKAGDNPMATPAYEDVDPRASFGRDLMAEYQALKLRK